MDEKMTLREKQAQLTRDILFKTALKLFNEKGYENTTIQEISKAAGTSSRTFFRYFTNKEEIILDTLAIIERKLPTDFGTKNINEPLIMFLLRSIDDIQIINPDLKSSYKQLYELILSNEKLHAAWLLKIEKIVDSWSLDITNAQSDISLTEARLTAKIIISTSGIAFKAFVEDNSENFTKHKDRVFSSLKRILSHQNEF